MKEFIVGAVDLSVGEACGYCAVDKVRYRRRTIDKLPEVGEVLGRYEDTEIFSTCYALSMHESKTYPQKTSDSQKNKVAICTAVSS